ncbi:type II secretion system F family protein [Cumulibacter soli]|uniref:type II secretion system F family protein n=1 Tax=Cumulibacter soli TaxID=2546344 RepID=UPI00106874C8|nr:type II secretion system F family protein [Cumulibacter soli]
MSFVLLMGAFAVLCWPLETTYVAVRRRRVGAAGTRLDRHMPVLLAALMFLLFVAWKPTIAGISMGVASAFGTYLALRRLRARVKPSVVDPALPLVLTVAGLLLRSGAPPGSALASAARSCGSESRSRCDQIERRLAVGETPADAWGGVADVPDLSAVGRAAIRTSDSGAALANAWSSIGVQLRADRRLAAEVRARKVGVRVLAPLGLCFLPSFICLGVVPMVIGLASDIL